MAILNTDFLNGSLSSRLVDARLAHIFNAGKNVLVTSSFGTTSVVLLHIINRVKPNYPIYFIDTGYHFSETLSYKKELTELMNLNVIDVKPEEWKHQFTREDRTWEKDPDYCCQINKVEPMEKVKSGYDVWISGLMGYQNQHRSNLEFVREQKGIYKYYPLIDWTRQMVEDYFEMYGLPRHPLEREGYGSIGCTHCTSKGACREGRWQNSGKSECGLHFA